jgi:hypothetical protein
MRACLTRAFPVRALPVAAWPLTGGLRFPFAPPGVLRGFACASGLPSELVRPSGRGRRGLSAPLGLGRMMRFSSSSSAERRFSGLSRAAGGESEPMTAPTRFWRIGKGNSDSAGLLRTRGFVPRVADGAAWPRGTGGRELRLAAGAFWGAFRVTRPLVPAGASADSGLESVSGREAGSPLWSRLN